MKFLWRVSIAVCELCILTVATDFSDAIEKPERVDDQLKEVEGIEDEDHDEEALPVTYQVMDANIKVKEPASTDETLENLDKDWDKKRAIRDVAYFIRAHKFRDYDRRYYREVSEVSRHLYQGFPKPALRSLHWEVHKFCVSGFDACLNYVERIVKLTSLRREDDTVTVMRENSWNLENNTEEILATQKDCEMAKRRDNRSALPFAGPIERFQWRTTVSYYMCWYTMLGIPELALFGEPCDNHANCLDQYGNNNRDPRADDTTPYACALYSFCPDHCCPIKHIWYMKDCFQSQENPCHYGKRGDAYEAPELSPEGRCIMVREDNKDFSSLVADRINVTCECQHTGYEWSSRFGLCVDVNECAQSQHNCSEEEGETCFNLPGRFACVCRLGYVYNDEKKSCVKSPSIEKTLRDLVIERNDTESKSLFALIVEKVSRSSGSCAVTDIAFPFVWLVAFML
ncbi:uncharacterized protein LOC107270700 [Cephus cinctus]|uniref:Uncharacterized protein LOC107270700 n=1 Tax=Cephus cinctus TaxID=211228 RepID=A0AAJ7W451_CEPCN|nr:uncharacterized protein LOC107270700 [Cephus cinctus]